MSTDLIDDLDEALADAGETVTLRRPGTPAVDVSVRAHVRYTDVADMVTGGGIYQQKLDIIISPTEIIAAGWPGTPPTGFVGDTRIPVKSDQVIAQGRPRRIIAVHPITTGGDLVRINITAQG